MWNRTPGKGSDLDATIAGTAAGAIAASPLVIVCVLNHQAVRSVLDPDALKGRTLAGPEAALLYSGPTDAGHGSAGFSRLAVLQPFCPGRL